MKNFFAKRTWVIFFIMCLIAVSISLFLAYYEFTFRKNIKYLEASSGDNVTGWAWNSNIGWISFNCSNDSSCAASNYGVNIDLPTGNIGGSAWSPNVGWIDFGPVADLVAYPGCGYPEAPCNAAKYNSGTGAVTGWAKILTMGNNGWIKLSGSWTNGVSINPSTGDFSGWAWNANDSGEGIGWISFNCSNDSSCGSSNYKVAADISQTPSVSGLTAPNWNFAQAAGAGGALRANLHFDFIDPDPASSGSAYQIKVIKKNGLITVLDTGKCTGFSLPAADCKIDIACMWKAGGCHNQGDCTCVYPLGSELEYNTAYQWSVKVWDNFNKPSLGETWYATNPDTDNNDSVVDTFTTYKHEFPDVNVTIFPAEPSKAEEVKFTGTGFTYKSAVNPNDQVTPATPVPCDETLCGWFWTEPNNSTIENADTATPTLIFNGAGSNTVKVKVTDTIDGYYTEINLPLDVNVKLPKWKEVKPE